MVNLSGISSSSFAGKLLRYPLRLIPSGTRVPILQGSIKGWYWIVGSGNHGYWLGSYEHAHRRQFEKHVFKDNVVYDVGAHVGFYTLLASSLVGDGGHVVAFEPLSENQKYLNLHLSMNRVTNVTVVNKAVSDRVDIVQFHRHENSTMGGISSDGEMSVPSTSLDEWLEHSEIPPPNCIKIDVEGAECLVLEGAQKILSTYRPTIFLSTHGESVHTWCCRFLERFEYDLMPLDSSEIQLCSSLLALGRP